MLSVVRWPRRLDNILKKKVEAVQYTWNGSDASYTDPTNWTPQDVPLYGSGDLAVIQSGTVTLSNAEPNNITVALAGRTEAGQPNLVLDNAAFGPGVFLTLVSPANALPGGAPDLGFATLTVDGYGTNEGRISLGGGQTSPDFLTIAIAPHGQLNQEGTINVFNGSRLQVNGTEGAPATLNNDGTIGLGGGYATISADVIGSGVIALLPFSSGSGSVEFGGSVAATQHVAFSSTSPAQIRIDDPSAFHGIIDGFQGPPPNSAGPPFYSITLADTQATGTYFAQVTPDAGALLVLNGQEVVGALTVTGTHAPNSFGFFNNPDGSATLT